MPAADSPFTVPATLTSRMRYYLYQRHPDYPRTGTLSYILYIYQSYSRNQKLFRGDLLVEGGGGGGPTLFYVNLINFNIPGGGPNASPPPPICAFILELLLGSVCLKENKLLFFEIIGSLVNGKMRQHRIKSTVEKQLKTYSGQL